MVITPLEDEGSEDEESCATITHAQACATLETVVKYLEQEPDIPLNTTIIVNQLLINAAKKKKEKLIFFIYFIFMHFLHNFHEYTL